MQQVISSLPLAPDTQQTQDAQGEEDHMYQLMFSAGTEVPQEDDEVPTVLDETVIRQHLQPSQARLSQRG